MLIATLIAADRLEESLVDRALLLLKYFDAEARFDRWIDEGDAADFSFDGDQRQARAALETLENVDVIVQPAASRRKKLIVADMDSTIIGQECIDELADYAGCKAAVAAITDRAMRGEVDFVGALNERVALLHGLDQAVIEQCLAERIRLNPGAETLVRTMRSQGADSLLVSGGFKRFVSPIAGSAGFTQFVANELEVAEGRLTGKISGRIVDSAYKRQALIDARERLGLSPDEVLAIGDGANDIPMINEAGLGISFRAKPALAAAADGVIRLGGLDSLLWAQGIPKSDWVRA